MPLTKLQFKPGINKDVTSYSNEGGWVDGDKVRFRLGYPEKIGGWLKYSSNQFLGVCRALHNWITLNGSNYLGIGTHLKYYIEEGGAFNDITPLRSTSVANAISFSANELFSCSAVSGNFTVGETITGGTSGATGTVNNFIAPSGVLVAVGGRTGTFVTGETITGGSSGQTATISSFAFSSTVTVTHANHGAIVSDFVTFNSAESLGGNITAAVLNDEHQVVDVISSSQYEIVVSATASASDVLDGSTDGVLTLTGTTNAGVTFERLTSNNTSVSSAAAVNPFENNNPISTVSVNSGTSTGSATFTGVTGSSSGGGTGAEFTITANGSGGYTIDSLTNPGTGYDTSETITVLGTSLGGTSPTNDLVIDIDSVVKGTVSKTYSAGGKTVTVLLEATTDASTTTLVSSGPPALYRYTFDYSYTVKEITVAGSGWSVGDSLSFSFPISPFGGFIATPLVSAPQILGFDVADLVNNSVGEYQINVGLNSQVGGTGWGAGTWGRGGWGSGSSITTTTNIRLWSHDNFGENLLINPRDANIYYWTKSSGLAARAVELSTLAGSTSVPQIAKQVIVSDQDRHVIAFGCDALGSSSSDTQGNGVQDPLLVRFSSQENPNDWWPTDVNTAGDLILGSGSQFVQAVETKREILVWTDTSLHSMRFIGPPFTFGLQQLASNITIIGPNAAVATEDVVYWMGIDNFYTYSGQTQQLECTVKDHVFNDFNLSQTDKVFGGVNSEFSEVIWVYPSDSNSLANGGTGENDRYVIYNYKDNIWYYGTLERSAWIDRGTRPYPIATEGGYLYNHEYEYDADGVAMDSFIESAPMDIGDGDKFSLATTVVPDLTFVGSTSLASPQATFTLKARTEPGAAYNSTSSGSAVRTSTSPVETFTEIINLRVRGRSFAVRVESSALGTKWKLGSPRVDIRPDGRR